jgi:hypothetical protein
MLYRGRDGSRGMEPVHGFNLRWLVAKESPVEGKPGRNSVTKQSFDSLVRRGGSAIERRRCW